ncbi:MAG: FtsX-like permease family protein [Steroidobacteraceae bacterium]
MKAPGFAGGWLLAALRNLARNRLHAVINILGLSAAFAAALLIGIYVHHERSFERFMPGHADVYRLSAALLKGGAAANGTDDLRGPVAEELRSYFPQIQAIAELRNTFGNVSLRRGSVESLEPTFAWADPKAFDVLPFPVVAGDARAALARPDGLVLTRRMARKYFGKDLPMGETIEVYREYTLRVMAVLEDLPSSTHLATEIFGSTLALPPVPPGMVYRTYVYLRLAPGASPALLRAALPAFLDRNSSAPVSGGKSSSLLELQLIPIADIHLRPAGALNMKPAGDPLLLNALTVVGGLILLVAIINFINLMTVRAARRGVEVGIRKAAGAHPSDILMQFVGEAMVHAFIALLIAAAAGELLMPHLNAFVDRQMRFNYLQLPVAAGLLFATAGIGALAGLYPALVVSRFNPAMVLKGGGLPGLGSGQLRQMLVLLQFAILIGLVLATGVVHLQTRFGLNQGLRFDTDQLLMINVPASQCEHSAFTDAVRALPGVLGTACDSDILGNYGSQQYRGSGREVTLQNSSIGPGLFELMGLAPVAGRFYARDREGDVFPSNPGDRSLSVAYPTVINETAARTLGYSDPSAALGQTFASISGARAGTRREIIGVVPDFARDSVRMVIAPVIYDNSGGYRLEVKLRHDRVAETLGSIDRLWKQHSPLPAPVSRRFYDQYVQERYSELARQGWLFSIFATLALLLAGVGLFGLASFVSERRTKEIGVRKALGANTADVFRLLLWQFARPVAWANLIAWPLAAWAMQRWLAGFAYHINLPLWLFPFAALLALLIALATVAVHTLRVAAARPVVALRCE